MFDKLKSMLTNGRFKAKGITWRDNVRPGCGASLPFLCSGNVAYDNVFPDVTRIAEAFSEVLPYAIDKNGRRMKKQPKVIEALCHPNEEMSGAEFLESLIVMMLVHPVVYILVWHYERGEVKPGGPVTKDNIAGFTFLQNPSVSKIDGATQYITSDAIYTKDDVITLSLNVNPYDILRGYSPTQAVKKWATVDDYIAEYQLGVFRNGAVPAGEMIVTASTVEEYNKAVDALQAAHRGAGNANNIVYTHRPTSSIDGKPMAAGVEWVPFAQTNKEMTLQSLFDQANKKIDMNFGVPEEVKGYLQNSNYASAEVADYVFSRRVLYPKLVKVYSRLNHELNRVTGGLDCALTFDYELPVLTDTRKIQAETLQIMLEAGFSVKSTVAALRLPRSFLQLESVNIPEETEQIETEDKERPHQSEKVVKTKAVSQIELSQNSTVTRTLSIYNLYHINTLFSGESTSEITVNMLKNLIIASLYYILLNQEMERQNEFTRNLGTNVTVPMTSSELSEAYFEIQEEIARLESAIESGQSLPGTLLNGGSIARLISVVDVSLAKFGLQRVIDSVGADNYHEQLDKLIDLFAAQTIAQITEFGVVADLAIDEKENILQAIRETNNYRINRWSMSEEHRAEEVGNLLAAEEATVDSDLVPMKIWRAHMNSGRTCQNCRDMGGQKVPANQPFSNGEMTPHYHPHCRCEMEIIFEEMKKTVKVTCPHCKRYMFDSEGGSMKNVICANSKCKRHYDIKVRGGKIEAVERDK